MTAAGNGDAGRLDPVLEGALQQLRAFTYRRLHLRTAATPRPRPGSSRSRPAALREYIRLAARISLEDRERSLEDPSARSGAIHIFKHLKHHGYTWDPEDVHAWAITHGFTAEDARRLAEYAQGVRAGTRYHTQPDPFGRHAIIHWQEDADRHQTDLRSQLGDHNSE